MLDQILSAAPRYLLVAVRCFALIMTLPLFSMRGVSRAAKIAVTGYVAFLVLPVSYGAGYEQFIDIYGAFTLEYVLLLIGEGLLGIITGFYISVIFAAFSTAGQFFSFQMGLSAAEAYDSLSQVENPLMGQYLNLIAMLLFLQVKGFQQLFLGGIFRSFQSLNALALVLPETRSAFLNFLLSGLTDLFFDALMISLPMVGTFFLVSVAMGLLSKAAPQMNLLSEGIPLTMLVGFLLLFLLLPSMCDLFVRSFDTAFYKLERLLIDVGTAAGSVPLSGGSL
ncbi:flagellar biosynthetic protein FliR [Treponema brennaborense]|uniref:Flagellar biosynthetic protein FliR n=1 Tax=Treponema brennaborense (strain DSM 12168 / CIP 105900 / DD5/3) TaxID=906968 RepID=F4LKX0_TREBD|nr:flagellar biosynthetic protein FliR [Treponema brennaborense]AEE16567.1 flagellar biosynthetic protein FliR [Treponema brennaborense DSM 12168]